MKMSFAKLLVFGAVLAAVVCGCSVKETVFARVARVDIEVKSLQSYFSGVTGMPWQSADDVVASRLVDQFLDQEVVAYVAGEHSDVELSLDPGTRSAMLRTILPEICGEAPQVSEDVIQREIEQRGVEIAPAQAHVRQLLLEDLQSAETALERLVAGEDFVEVSRDVSRTPNAEGGGELGFIQQGVLAIELDNVIFSLAQAEISMPVEGPVGFHIFQVLEIVPEGPRRESEIMAEVARELNERYARAFVRECVDRLSREIGVKIFPQNLWFDYVGRYSGGSDDT